jgi:hypothetical protein
MQDVLQTIASRGGATASLRSDLQSILERQAGMAASQTIAALSCLACALSLGTFSSHILPHSFLLFL